MFASSYLPTILLVYSTLAPLSWCISPLLHLCVALPDEVPHPTPSYILSNHLELCCIHSDITSLPPFNICTAIYHPEDGCINNLRFVKQIKNCNGITILHRNTHDNSHQLKSISRIKSIPTIVISGTFLQHLTHLLF